MAKKNTSPLEGVEQELVFRWSRANSNKYPVLSWLNASLSGVRLSVGQRVKMKRQGMVKGFPDISLPVRSGQYSGLFLELKRIRGGRTSREQLRWIEMLNAEGYKALVVKGADAAIREILTYISKRED